MRVSEESSPSAEGTGPTKACDDQVPAAEGQRGVEARAQGSARTEHSRWGQPHGCRERRAGSWVCRLWFFLGCTPGASFEK